MSYTDTCDLIIMYCQGLTNKYDRSLRVTDIYFLKKFHYMFELREFNLKMKEETKLPIIAPYIYDARYHAHAYYTKYLVIAVAMHGT